MSSFIDRLFNREPQSAKIAKDRLKLVLVHDRSEIPPGILDILKDDMIEVISQHVEIDATSVRIKIKKEGRKQRLIADIPLRVNQSRRRRRY